MTSFRSHCNVGIIIPMLKETEFLPVYQLGIVALQSTLKCKTVVIVNALMCLWVSWGWVILAEFGWVPPNCRLGLCLAPHPPFLLRVGTSQDRRCKSQILLHMHNPNLYLHHICQCSIGQNKSRGQAQSQWGRKYNSPKEVVVREGVSISEK